MGKIKQNFPGALHKVKSFTIDRGKWLHGYLDLPSMLLDSEGNMCCLGFFGRACGIDAKTLRGAGAPDSTKKTQKSFRQITDNSLVDRAGARAPLCSRLMLANDRSNMFERDKRSEKDRENEIISLFAEIGVKVKFKGRRE